MTEKVIGDRPRTSKVLYVIFAATAGVVGAVISWAFLGASLAALGIPDPGPLTTAGLPFLRSAGLMLAALAIGSFMAAAFFIKPKDSDLQSTLLSVDGSIAARTGAVSSLCFAVIAQLMVPMYLSDVSGSPLKDTLNPTQWLQALQLVSTSVAWQVTAGFALITGLGALTTYRWIMQPVWLTGAILAVVPLGMEGHSATGGDHDYGTNSYLWHLIFMMLWVGGLMALIAHGRRKGPALDVAVRRYSAVALVSVVVMAVSGVINTSIRMHWTDLLTTGYGLLILAKTIGVVVLALFGFVHRQLTIPKLADNNKLFRRVAAVEVLVMGAVTGVAISLGRTPPPPPRNVDLNTMDIELGYRLYQEPTFWNVWTMWRFDILFGAAAIIFAVGYLWAVLRVHKNGGSWPITRTLWFLLGCAVLLLTVCSGIGMNMPATFSMHMVGHMILTMGAPVAWVLGGPVTLFLQALRPSPDNPGPREWLEVAVDNPWLRFLMNPAVNTIQFVVFFYILYITPLYEIMIDEHAGHLIMNVVFLWSGSLYYWDLIGVDKAPVEHSPMSKLGWLTFSMPFHLFFGVYLMMATQIMGEEFYTKLGLPWHVDLLHDQVVGGGISWGSGQFPLLIVWAVLIWEWFADDRRRTTEMESNPQEVEDDLEAYNAQLAAFQHGKNPHDDYYSETFER
ncbi:bifunctional copper resistance protein CopD/cytochrome c oxidase assembly protein [Corynebacterium hindlerae]|uniref:Bifunctional copper resistance protein CopD/cytochrome c oxidase assembly protein n=1 Tax=Corynebacterium hindlerae TaxID=699041 RepID=A0A7G5FDR1_9CORY|nr:cytochrome c oxidase assembly protein [Corynebacterium hindlerae]QMV84752.1 bifunctional copper resistance protein CopD/cytochrome c oxidase assembly protein [Corynebacterium hindlerae]